MKVGYMALLAALVVGAMTLSGCSTGGYVQIGWVPVSHVDDNHRNVPEAYERRGK